MRDRAGHPTVLVAAAGSGKTRVLTWLYTDAHLQEHLRIDQLLAITFTNRAAGELRERIAHELRGTALGRDPISPRRGSARSTASARGCSASSRTTAASTPASR